MEAKPHFIPVLCCLFAACALACVTGFASSSMPASPLGKALATTATSTAKAPAKPTKSQLKVFKKASARFSLKLFSKSVAKNGTKNTVVAPMSVLTALTLAGNGSAGKTRTEMQNVLAGGKKMNRLNKNLSWFNSQLTNTGAARLNTANAIWYNNDGSVTINNSFIETNKRHFDACIQGADFSDPKTVDSINEWVSQRTNKMIPKTLDKLEEYSKTVLVNTLYFNAKWKVSYDPLSTNKQSFKPANGKKHKVEMMHAKEHKYIEADGVKGFVKPYKKGYSFVALLPKKGTSLKKFVKKLSGKSFVKLVKSSKKASVITTVPKLDMEYSDYQMAKKLKKMGLKLSTNRNKANFSKMGTCKDGRLYIGDVVHKTRLKLDEKGTEAAAVTAIVLKESSAVFQREKPKIVKLNRPFVFAIVDNKTKLPLFMGAVNDVK